MEAPPIATDQHLPIAIVAVIIIGVLATILRSSIARRNRHEAQADYLLQLGYMPVTASPRVLTERIDALYHLNGDHQLIYKRIFKRPIAGGELYLLDVQGAGSGATSSRSQTLIVVVSSALDMPRFSLIPHMSLGQSTSGPLSRLADTAITWVAAQSDLERVAFDGDLEFTDVFVTLAAEPAAVKRYLVNRRRTELLQIPRRYLLDAGGDTVILSQSPEHRPTPDLGEQLPDVQYDAERILNCLHKDRIHYA